MLKFLLQYFNFDARKLLFSAIPFLFFASQKHQHSGGNANISLFFCGGGGGKGKREKQLWNSEK